MGENAGPIALVVLIVVLIVGYFVWRSSSMQGPGGLSLADAGAQKQSAVDAAAATAASSAAGT